MAIPKPHYLLFCDASLLAPVASHAEPKGRWRFVLEDVISGEKVEASDFEETDHVDRVSLLAVMRGLEALEQPSRVTLVTTSRYVARGLQYGLAEWRENDYCWEHFGSVQPIRNDDLWRRMDVALRFHEVQCRWMAQDNPTVEEPMPRPAMVREPSPKAREGVIPVLVEADVIQGADAERWVAIPSPELEAKNQIDEHRTGESTETAAASDPKALQPAPALSVVSVPAIPPARRHAHSDGRLAFRLWSLILAADAFLVSCLRCLLLMDPRRDHFRPRNF